MSIFREFNINMIPGKPPLIIHASQYESDFVYTFHLVSGKNVLAIPDTAIAVIRGTKRDGNGFSKEASLDTENNKVVVIGEAQMTACAGKNVFELAIINDNKTICTSNFFLDVERAPLDAGTIQSESVLRELQAIIDSAEISTQAAQEASASAESAASAAEQAVEQKFEDGVTETIDEWLTDHPEATTTVQDGAITEAKLATALKLKTIKDYVTPEMFGAVGDGVADDTNAFNNMLTSVGVNGVVKLLKKTYRLTSTIVLPVGIEIGGSGTSSVIYVDHESNAFNLSDGYSGNYIHDFTITGGEDSVYCFNVARPQCTFERLYFPNYNGDGFIVTNGDVTGGYATWFKNIKFVGVKNTAFARKHGVDIDVNGGLVVFDKCNFALCSVAILVVNCDGVFISNSNISECNHTLVPVTSESTCFGIFCTGGKSISVSDCYLENLNTLISVDGAENITIKNSYINLLAQSIIGCLLTSGINFSMNNCYFKSEYSQAVAVSIGSTFRGLVDLTNNVFSVTSGTIYRGNIIRVLYNDDNGYFTQLRQAVKSIDSNTTDITEVGNYISTGTVNIVLSTSSITITGGVINLYVSTGTLTLTIPYAYGGTRTYSLSGGMGCSIIKNPNGYYSVLGATPDA